jgi:hypothetical protein
MMLLGDPPCPQCQAPVPLAGLWQRATKDRGGIFLIGQVGIGCPACEAKLRVLQANLAIAAVGSFAAFCAAFGVLGAIEHARVGAARQDLNLLLIAPAIVGWMLLFRRYGYRFARVRALEDGEKVAFPLSRPVATAPIADDRPDRKAINVGPSSQTAESPAVSADIEKTPWICPECGEENPGKFNICCVCETHRDTSEQG